MPSHGRRFFIFAVSLLSLLLGMNSAPARAQTQPRGPLHSYVLTFGPGDHPFFKFGHNAIWIRPEGGRGLVFNFGTFAFDSPALIPKFLKGRLNYWLSVSPDEDTFYSYQAANRSIAA